MPEDVNLQNTEWSELFFPTSTKKVTMEMRIVIPNKAKIPMAERMS